MFCSYSTTIKRPLKLDQEVNNGDKHHRKRASMKLKSALASLVVKFLDVDTLCALVAKAIASLLLYASKKGGRAWDIAKDTVVKINLWTSLFLQVYEDDTLSQDDEEKIADAIKRETSIAKFADILRK